LNKRIAVVVMLPVAVIGLTAGCSGNLGTTDDSPSEHAASSSSTPAPVDSHAFEGKGTRITDFLADEERVTLSGDYTVHWEINGNQFASSDGKQQDGPFELSLFCDTDPPHQDLKQTDIANETLTEGSDEKQLSIPGTQGCQLNVVSSDAGAWTVTVERG
jgi:hypothetical protein